MNWFNNLKVGTKLISVLMLVMLVAGVVDLIGVVSMQLIRQDTGTLYSTYGVATADVATLGTTFSDNRNSLQDVLIDPLNAKEYVSEIQANDKELELTLAKVNKTIQSAEERQIFNNINDNLKQYKSVRDNVIEMVLANHQDQGIALFRSEGTTPSDTVKSAIEKLMQVKVAGGLQKNNQITGTNAVTTMIIMLVLMVIGTLIALALGLLSSRNIAKPIKQLKDAAQKIADGDLDVAVEVKSKDEIGELSSAFREMSYNLHEVIANVNSAAEQVALGAKQLSQSSNALSQGATEQASAVEELNSSIAEISSQTQLNAHNADEANKLAESAKANAVAGNMQMQEMLKAMEEINQASRGISKIIKTIDEIAFQTNILALNAAVEAARAGQHGKGFAVVAEEVRNLAARSAEAAKETTAMIEGSIKKVDTGTRLAKQAADALNEIVEGVSKVAGLVGDIAIASSEQATGAAQITHGIAQVSQVVQTTSATSEESAASSTELASQAEALKHQVDRFTFKKQPPVGLEGIEAKNILELFAQKSQQDGTDWHQLKAWAEAAATSSRTK